MKIIVGLLFGAFCLGVQTFGQSTNANTTNMITGSWDFDARDLRATTGSPLEFRGDTTNVIRWETSRIGEAAAGVIRLPALTSSQGLVLNHGGGTNLTQYSLLMDVMWPSESDGTWRAILQSDLDNTNDAILFVNPENRLGINNVYEGELPVNTWHRIAVTFNTANGELVKYINGQLVSTQIIGDSMRFNLGPAALLFTDDTDETAPVLINSIQFRSVAMAQEEIAQLGGPNAAGFSGTRVPEGDVKIDSIRKDGTDVVLTVSGGGNLQLQRTAALAPASWQNVGTPAVTNTFRVPATDPKAFFRVERR